jgi:hypothetical protein
VARELSEEPHESWEGKHGVIRDEEKLSECFGTSNNKLEHA